MSKTAAAFRQLTEGVHIIDAPQRFKGLEVGARMTVLELEGGLFLHSPLATDSTLVERIGAPRWVLAPNLLHHLYIGPWAAAGLETLGAPGLAEKRPDVRFHQIITSPTRLASDELELFPLSCIPMTNEVLVLHRPSRTLILSDLVFNFGPDAPWLTRTAMRCLCGYPGCRTTLLERLSMRRDLARRELQVLSDWDYDRVIMAHGQVIERGGKDAVLGALRWLGLEAFSP